MDLALRLAWTAIITADDYEEHMAAVGQAEAAAMLTRHILETAAPPEGGRVEIVGAGTGQMFDFLEAELWRPFLVTCTDLNRRFLDRLEERLARYGIEAAVREDDIERTALEAGADLLLVTLVLEHIDWRRGVAALAGLRPAACGVILQENPPGMTAAVTPGRRVPASIAQAVQIAHPTLVPREELSAAFAAHGYECRDVRAVEVADWKRLVAMLWTRE